MQRQVWKENSWKDKIKVDKEEKKEKKAYEIGSNPFDADYMLLLREQRELEQKQEEER